MPARVVVIGMDAAEATLLEKWASQGKLPTFASLAAKGRVRRLANSLETLPGAIWPEIVSGRSCGTVPLYYHPRQLHSGEAEVRPVLREEVDPRDYFWAQASAAGRRVAAIDMPQTVVSPGLNGIQIFEWGLHDRNFEITSDPPDLLESIQRRYGEHPVSSCDRHGQRVEEYTALLEGLIKGVNTKSEILLELLQREDWDLFSCTYGECHCVGHQFWHFFDEEHTWYQQNISPVLRNGIETVYQKIDDGIGRLIAAAGPDANILVVASHGMGPYTGGPQLLPEVLVQLGLGSDTKQITALSRLLRNIQGHLHHSPRAIQPFLKKLAKFGPVKGVQASAGCLLNPLESPTTSAVALQNNRCGAIRLNMKGREPYGRVQLGLESEQLLHNISDELLKLRDPETDELIVAETITAQKAFGPDHHPDVPDLMIVFRTDLGLLEKCHSASVGEIQAGLFHPNIPRSGDHTIESRLWAIGPSFEASPADAPPANILDIAPTVLRLLDVPLQDELDGQSLI